MKKIFLLLLIFSSIKSFAQNKTIDSLKQLLSIAKEDTNKVWILDALSENYTWSFADTAVMYAQQGLQLAQKISFKSGQAWCMCDLGNALTTLGNYSMALNWGFKSLSLFKTFNDTLGICWAFGCLGGAYRDEGDYKKSLSYFFQEKQFKPDWGDDVISAVYERNNQLDSALFYADRAYNGGDQRSGLLTVLGTIHAKLGNLSLALEFYKKAVPVAIKNFVQIDILDAYNGIAQVYLNERKTDSAIYYARQSLSQKWGRVYPIGVLHASTLLANIYESKHQTDSTLKYLKLTNSLKDSLFNQQKTREVQSFAFNEQLHQQELHQQLEQSKLKYRNRLKIYILLAGLLILLLIAVGLWRRNIFKQKAYSLLQKQKEKIDKQKKEADTEAALERVRSKAMAMQDSSELAELVDTLYKELAKLDFALTWCMINIIDENTASTTIWLANHETGRLPESYHLKFADFPYPNAMWQAWKERKIKWVYEEYGIEKETYENYLITETEFSRVPEAIKAQMKATERYLSSFTFANFGGLQTVGTEPLPDANFDILVRFGKVFDQTYTRFLDLKKAELRAREAQIESALERVRSKAMAMHNSEDVGDATVALFSELDKLEISILRCGIIIIDESKTMEVWTAGPNKDGKVGRIIGRLDMTIHPMLEEAYTVWKQNKPFNTYELVGEDMLNYYKAVSTYSGYPIPSDMEAYYNIILNQHAGNISKEEIRRLKQSCSIFFFREGGLFAFTKDELSKENCRVLEKFTAVFALTYHRYLELKQAESNAKEALSRASIDRVRAEIASMRSVNDLEKITPLIWNELTTLGVSFIRCGVFIINKEEKIVHSYLSTPDGKAIAAFQLPFGSSEFLNKLLESWNNNKILLDYWDETTFLKWTETLVESGAIQSPENYITEKLSSGLHLHLVPFLQGMLYVGNNAALKNDKIKLIQLLAKAFSTAYARYEDFNKLEIAKQQVEFTLQELKSTQSQLIQSEKMASLGELTAGIAHEIQNPLNFVNNFSEVNREMLIELKEEIDKRNYDEVKVIADDIEANEEKINHHGKRADAIVKNMLQHSRQTKGVKEPTDINALCEEYLRLSYHGMRAKDKSFNADLKTDFDETIGKISIVGQDIGRVLLNLFNNAFYAVNEKAKLLAKSYQPIASVTTKKSDNHVIITVSDNGNGIPQKIIDKIFQPFFTTKRTGEGTGLGLSLSYDIIKANGGEIKVETKEGEGSEFAIQLPFK